MDVTRFRRTLVAVLVAGAVTAASTGAAVGDERGRSDFAVGSGVNQIGHVSFAAHGGPTPFEPVRGHFTAKGALAAIGEAEVGEFHFEGPVTCLTVVGKTAGLYYPLKNSNPPEFEGQGIFITLKDNGNPTSGVPDEIGFVGPVPAPQEPLACPPGPTPVAFRSGNITIHDAP